MWVVTMLNTKILVLVFVLSLSLLGLVKVKVYVQDLREEIVETTKVKRNLSDEVQVLRAEWSNLNRPERLRTLSDQYLSLENMESRRVKHLSNKSKSVSVSITPVKNSVDALNISWRYKPREMVMNTGKNK